MTDFAWRIPVRIVAVLNLIICSIWIITIVLFTITLIQHGPDAFSEEMEDIGDSTGILCYPWVLFAALTFGFLLSLWVSLILMTATDRGIEPEKAARLLKNWGLSYSAPVVILLLIVYKFGATKQIDWTLASFGGFVTPSVLIVREYRKELDKSQSPISIKDIESA